MTRATSQGIRHLVSPDDYFRRRRRFADLTGRRPTVAESDWLRHGWVPGTLR